MPDYKNLLEALANRQLGILGKMKTRKIFSECGVALDDDCRLSADGAGYEQFEAVTAKLFETYGAVPIMGARLLIVRMAREGGLRLPPHFG